MENKKIGMAINYDYHDYGGMLQAYASYKKIMDLGYCPEVIDIENISKDIRKRKILYFMRNIFDVSIVKEKSQIVYKKIRKKYDKKLCNNLKKRYDAFEKFQKSHFIRSRKYLSWLDLSNGCREYSSIVVGSDQLWLPSNIAGDYYTLSFVPDNVNKISYATSFGVSDIAKKQSRHVERFLNRINYLSAREESGKEIIKKYTGKDVQIVCDPALLLTSKEWDKELNSTRIIDEKYVFCYFMGNNLWQREFVKKIKNRTGYKIVSLLHLDQYIKSDENFADITPYDITPFDFVNLVKNAEIVCTDSFHGTVFSLIYEKKFFTFMRFSDKDTLSTNSRIKTLMKLFEVENRVVQKEYNFDKLMRLEIDSVKIQNKLNSFRKESLDYLKRALEKK